MKVAVSGTGLLSTAVLDTLENRGEFIVSSNADGRDIDVVITASDAWDTSLHEPARKLATRHGAALLTVHTELGTVVIGPTERPGVAGCAECIRRRRSITPADAQQRSAVLKKYRSQLTAVPSKQLDPLAADTVAAVVADDVARMAVGQPGEPRTQGAVLMFDLTEHTVATHRFLPDPQCPVCGTLPDDSAELADLRTRLRPRPKPAREVYRLRKLNGDIERLKDLYIDDETGVLRSLGRVTSNDIAVAAAALPLPFGGMTEYGSGRSSSYAESELIAILEAIERHGGTEPSGRRHWVRGRYDELHDQALDPRALGVHPPDSYQHPEFHFTPFTEDQELNWCWGYSFGRQAPILVPETIAYYAMPHRHDNPLHIDECSNGCALGSCLEEAILYGLLEVAERDAFLMTWYTRLPVPRIDPSELADPQVRQAIALINNSGYQLYLFDTTMEQKISCVWAMAVHPDNLETTAKTVSCAGSHLRMDHAVRNALNELGPILATHTNRSAQDITGSRNMVTDPMLVREMSDHSLLYGDTEAFDRFDFLLGPRAMRKPHELPSASPGFGHTDLTEDLHEAVGRYLDRGQDVIVVDQTTPEHKAGGFHCAKVLITGTLSMTFGHLNRRTANVPRLQTTPVTLGYRQTPLPEEEINPHPHPFP